MAVVTGKSYGNEWEMQYFQKTFNKYVLKVGDIDCREPEELLWVEPSVDRRGRYAFSEWKTVLLRNTYRFTQWMFVTLTK